MWKNWVNGILGLGIIFLPFAGLSYSFERAAFVLIGIIIAILAFWFASENRHRIS